MAAGANKLICRAFDIVLAKVYADMYDVDCLEKDCETLFLNLLFASEVDCELPHSLECYIDKVVDSLSEPTPFAVSTVANCSVNILVIEETNSVCTPPEITIL